MAKSFDELANRTMTKAARARATRRARQMMAGLFLADLRRAGGVTQKQLARALGIKQPTLSKLEKQDDMQLSTLRRVVERLGGQLRIVADLPHGQYAISPGDAPAKRPAPCGPHRVRAA